MDCMIRFLWSTTGSLYSQSTWIKTLNSSCYLVSIHPPLFTLAASLYKGSSARWPQFSLGFLLSSVRFYSTWPDEFKGNFAQLCLGISCRSENMAAQQICHECGLARPSWQVPCGRKRSLCEVPFRKWMQTWNWWNFELWSYKGNWKPKPSIMFGRSISKIRVTQQIAERVIYPVIYVFIYYIFIWLFGRFTFLKYFMNQSRRCSTCGFRLPGVLPAMVRSLLLLGDPGHHV